MPDPKKKTDPGRQVAKKSPSRYSVGTYQDYSFGSAPAPRVGGKAPKSQGMAKGTAKKSPIKKAIRKVNKTAAHPAAKAAAKRTYR